MLRLIVFILIGYLILSTGVLGSFGPSRADVSIKGPEITVSTSSAEMHFVAGPPTRLDGKVIDWRKAPGSFGRMGAQSIASMLSAADFVKFAEIENSGRCPASFLNGHGKTYVFFAENPALAERISRSAYKQGEQPQLNGRPLRFKKGTYNGMDLRAFNNGENLFLVTQ